MFKQPMTIGILAGLLGISALAAPAFAQESTENRLRRLEERVQKQDQEIQRLHQQLDGTRKATDALGTAIDGYLAKGSDEGWFSEPGTLRAFWKDGLRFQSSDKAFELEVGGRVNYDFAWFDADSAVEDRLGAFENRAGLRRGRVLVAGKIYDRVHYKAEYDFAKGSASLADVYVGMSGVPVLGTIRIGNQKEPMSLEWLTSGKFTTFMERGLPNALVPERAVGISAENDALDGRLFWALGVFGNTENGRGGTPKNVTARVAGIPFVENGGEHLVLVGASVSRRDPEGGMEQLGEKPEANFADHHVVDTGAFPVDSETRLGLESAVVWGPFSGQGEYVHVVTDAPMVGDPSFSGWYVFGSWVVTGEHRRLKGSAFTRLSPAHDFLDGDGGSGAVELALRYSHLDLADAGVDGGDASDWTFAVNWYLNPNTRIRLNYILSDPSGEGNLRILMLRFEVEF